MRDLGGRAASLLIGQSPLMQNVRDLLGIAGPTSLCVMIQGETGTGKELAARAIHEASKRQGAFVAINACAIAESMFEDALFGHTRGAFTGAVADFRGYVGEADGGTLFLDEITGLTPASQAKLLRVLETREYRPLGGRSDRHSDFRVIAASNYPLDELIARQLFRPDLAYRLRGIELWMPALRDRRCDIAALAHYFAATPLSAADDVLTIDSEAISALEAHDWPGNVRELRQVVARTAAYAKGTETIGLTHLRRAWPRVSQREVPEKEIARDDMLEFSRRRMIELLERHGWSTLAAAEELGVTRKTIYMRLRRLDIAIPRRYERREVPGRIVNCESEGGRGINRSSG